MLPTGSSKGRGLNPVLVGRTLVCQCGSCGDELRVPHLVDVSAVSVENALNMRDLADQKAHRLREALEDIANYTGDDPTYPVDRALQVLGGEG